MAFAVAPDASVAFTVSVPVPGCAPAGTSTCTRGPLTETGKPWASASKVTGASAGPSTATFKYVEVPGGAVIASGTTNLNEALGAGPPQAARKNNEDTTHV